MNLPGQTYDPAVVEALPSDVRRMAPADRERWCAEFNERNGVVATCQDCGRRLREGEQVPHRLRHASNGRVRAAAGTVLNLADDADRREALAILQELI